nr:metallophosphoesterase family protein [Mesorhizobium sp.]
MDATGPAGMRIYAIGDVHGRLDLLLQMHARIREEIERDAPADWRIVHVGDYVDRGPDSKGVIDFLVEAIRADSRHIALAGNHDAGLVEFLSMPDKDSLFARHGGRQTALSYGVDTDFSSQALARASAERLKAAMPREHVEFLSTLPRSVAFGDFFFCHAGIRPGVPLALQNPEDLIWIRESFLNSPLLYEKVVVHGHTPSQAPEIMPNRVNLDTAAFSTGVLTALSIDGTRKRILQIGEGGQREAWTTP